MRAVKAIILAVLLHACESRGPNDTPAVIVNPTPESRAELLRVVSEALRGVPVDLAGDALTDSNLLTIERKGRRDLKGRITGGRITEFPEQFHLVLGSSGCTLIHLATGRRYPLTDTSCAPLSVR